MGSPSAAALTVPLTSQDSSKGTSKSCKEMSTEVSKADPVGPVSDGGPPLVRAGLRGFLELGRFDVIAVVALVILAFGLRFASPIFPNFLSGGGAITALGVGFPTTGGSSAECTLVPVGPPAAGGIVFRPRTPAGEIVDGAADRGLRVQQLDVAARHHTVRQPIGGADVSGCASSAARPFLRH